MNEERVGGEEGKGWAKEGEIEKREEIGGERERQR